MRRRAHGGAAPLLRFGGFCFRGVDSAAPRMYNGRMDKNCDICKRGGERRSPLSAADVAACGLFVALMTAAACIRVPFPLVPLTFQTAVAVLCGMLLGPAKGAAAMCAYALAGLVGLPVFASGGGISYVAMPSFGYIVGFIAAAAAGGAFLRKGCSLKRCTAAAFAALAVNYAVGTAYFAAVWALSGNEGLAAAVAAYNLAYIPKDALLAVAAAAAASRIVPAIRARGSRRATKK